MAKSQTPIPGKPAVSEGISPRTPLTASPPSDQAIIADTAHVSSDSDHAATAEFIESSGQSLLAVRMASRTTVHMGPLPDPATLRELNNIYPGAAKLIFEDFHAQSAHRRTLEQSVVMSKIALAQRGQVLGGLIAAVGLIGSLIVIGLGHTTGGIAVATTCLLSLVGIFVSGQRNQTRELAEKAQIREKIKRGAPVEEIEGKNPQTGPPG